MTGYNGWKNKETWLVNLWLGDYFQQEIEEGQTICAAHIKDTLNNMLEDLPPQWGLFSDLLNCALGEVDCHEIADHYADEPEEDVYAATCDDPNCVCRQHPQWPDNVAGGCAASNGEDE